MLKQGFLRREGCGVGIPGGRNLIRASVDRPAAVADNTRQPMSFLVMMNALPVMGTPRRFRWLGFCGNRYGWGWFRGRRLSWSRLWGFRRLRWVGGFRFRHCGLCRLSRLGGNLCRLSRRSLRRGFRNSRGCGLRGRLGLNRLRWKRRDHHFLFCRFFRFRFCVGICCFGVIHGFSQRLRKRVLRCTCGCLELCGIRHGFGAGTSGNTYNCQEYCDCGQDFCFHRISPQLQEYCADFKSPERIGKFQENFYMDGPQGSSSSSSRISDCSNFCS